MGAAEKLMRAVEAGDDRIFAVRDDPPGIERCLRNGWLRRIEGTDRAELTMRGIESMSRFGAIRGRER